MPIGRRTARAIAAGALAIFGCGGPGHAPPTFAAGAAAAVATLEHRFYHAPGSWNACLPATACGTIANDWGADALTAALVFRRRVAHDDGVLPYLRALGAAAVTYGTCRLPLCTMWSDVPLWDAVADVRVYAATADPAALKKAQRAFAAVDGSDAFARGACADIDYQQPGGGSNRLKTLETDSNYITAALLLYRATRDRTYLAKARAKYRAVRRRFLDSRVPLYTVYLFDDGTRCAPLPHRFFASVNGIMIAAGLALTALTGEPGFGHQARETARAAAARLTDAAGVPADLQAGNDIGGPLVEAMAGIAAAPGGAFARHWLLAAARAARPAASGAFGRFFDGPPPGGPVSAWSADGGLELAIAAGALDPGRRPGGDGWAAARFVAAPVRTTPATIAFTGRGIALVGAIGAVCCEPGHARVFIDGRETFDATGIWQNKTPALRTLPNSVLFAWRWPRAGRHTVEIRPGAFNAKEGGPFIALTGYLVDP